MPETFQEERTPYVDLKTTCGKRQNAQSISYCHNNCLIYVQLRASNSDNKSEGCHNCFPVRVCVCLIQGVYFRALQEFILRPRMACGRYDKDK